MQQIPDSSNKNIRENNPSRTKPGLLLLNDQQWILVQKDHDLTIRERQIAELVCQGYKNRDIAKILKITVGTVKTHIRNIYRKTKVSSKIAMLLKFVTETHNLTQKASHISLIPIKEVKKHYENPQTPSGTPKKNY